MGHLLGQHQRTEKYFAHYKLYWVLSSHSAGQKMGRDQGQHLEQSFPFPSTPLSLCSGKATQMAQTKRPDAQWIFDFKEQSRNFQMTKLVLQSQKLRCLVGQGLTVPRRFQPMLVS